MPSGIPSAVQQQADEAKRKAEAAGEPPEEASPEPAEPAQPEEPASPEAPQEGPEEPAAKSPEQMTREELNSELDKPLPPSAAEGTEEAYWEHRFKVVKGLLDKEKAQMNREREQLNTRIRELEDQLQRQPQQPQQAPEGDLAQLRDEYGDQDPMVKALEAERERANRLEQTVQQLQGSQRESAEEQFWSDLNAQVPDWEQINARQDFLEWLNLADPMSGEIRDTLLQRHQQNGDGKRAAAIFDAFLTEHPQARQALRGEPKPQQPGVESQVEPKRTRTEPEPEQPPVYPLSEYQKFMQDVSKGRYSKAEADKWQREYANAIAEGRIDRSR